MSTIDFELVTLLNKTKDKEKYAEIQLNIYRIMKKSDKYYNDYNDIFIKIINYLYDSEEYYVNMDADKVDRLKIDIFEFIRELYKIPIKNHNFSYNDNMYIRKDVLLKELSDSIKVYEDIIILIENHIPIMNKVLEKINSFIIGDVLQHARVYRSKEDMNERLRLAQRNFTVMIMNLKMAKNMID